jgi:probable rRNA maturation factor
MSEEPEPADPQDDGHSRTVLVSNRQAMPVDEDGLAALASDTLAGEGLDAVELSLSFVDEAEIEELHVRFMDEPGPTDVLSFPLDADDVNERGQRVLGDVVIAPSVAARNAPEDTARELRLLVVHGILHLLGYDHIDDDEAERMETRERVLLEMVGRSRR